VALPKKKKKSGRKLLSKMMETGESCDEENLIWTNLEETNEMNDMVIEVEICNWALLSILGLAGVPEASKRVECPGLDETANWIDFIKHYFR
ncbi:hypothetical protein Tco_0195591, partial [Tanacetum coccineum]